MHRLLSYLAVEVCSEGGLAHNYAIRIVGKILGVLVVMLSLFSTGIIRLPNLLQHLITIGVAMFWPLIAVFCFTTVQQHAFLAESVDNIVCNDNLETCQVENVQDKLSTMVNVGLFLYVAQFGARYFFASARLRPNLELEQLEFDRTFLDYKWSTRITAFGIALWIAADPIMRYWNYQADQVKLTTFRNIFNMISPFATGLIPGFLSAASYIPFPYRFIPYVIVAAGFGVGIWNTTDYFKELFSSLMTVFGSTWQLFLGPGDTITRITGIGNFFYVVAVIIFTISPILFMMYKKRNIERNVRKVYQEIYLDFIGTVTDPAALLWVHEVMKDHIELPAPSEKDSKSDFFDKIINLVVLIRMKEKTLYGSGKDILSENARTSVERLLDDFKNEMDNIPNKPPDLTFNDEDLVFVKLLLFRKTTVVDTLHKEMQNQHVLEAEKKVQEFYKKQGNLKIPEEWMVYLLSSINKDDWNTVLWTANYADRATNSKANNMIRDNIKMFGTAANKARETFTSIKNKLPQNPYSVTQGRLPNSFLQTSCGITDHFL